MKVLEKEEYTFTDLPWNYACTDFFLQTDCYLNNYCLFYVKLNFQHVFTVF